MSDLPDLNLESKGYELRELLGKGGFGAVYRAYQQHVQREVALKIILPQYANQPDFVRRFEAEAQLVARLEHPYIVPLYDYWRDPHGAYLVLRMLRGGNLEESLQKGPWDIEATARLLEQIGSALTNAHQNGVVHQDLKPANILLDNEKNAYLTDFGIAKEVSKGKVGEVDEQPRQGTLHYISPEQLSYNPISFRSDIYSLGIMLYEILVGKPPFDGKSLDDMVYKHLYENVPSVQFERPELPEGINDVIAQATAKNPRARYADAVTMAAEFRQVVNDHINRSRQPVPSPVPKPIETAPTERKEISIADIPKDPVNPYKGLRPFQEADSADFFGREALLEKILKRLQEPGAFSSFLGIVGASGSGKSSVIKAGLIPMLRKGALHGSENWFYVEMTPKTHPIQELEQALMKVATKENVAFGELLRADDDYGLFRAVDQALPDEKSELFILIDQFEELYTLTESEAERDKFLKLLVKGVGEGLSRVWVIVTLRADFVDRPLQQQEFGNLLTERVEFVLPMSAKELEQAIVGPANRVGLKLEGSLVAVMVSDVNKQPGALPLLQYALMELYNNRKGITLTQDAYRSMGGISGALARRAEELYVGMKNESKLATRQLFLRLITINEGSDATRRRAMQSELISVSDEAERSRIQQIMNSFAKFRLLTFDTDPTTRAPTVEIAHEALIREWDQFRAWIRDSRENLQAQRRLTVATEDWEKAKRDGSFLASGVRLEEFEQLVTEKTLILNEQETAYVQASMKLRQRNTRVRQIIIAALISLTVFAVIGFVLATINAQQASNAAATAVAEQQRADAERERAEQEATISRAQATGLTAITSQSQTDLALLLSVQSLRTVNTFAGRNALLTSLLARPQLTQYLNGHTEDVSGVAFSPNIDQPILASADLDQTIRLWDWTTGQLIGTPLDAHEERVNAVAFSTDGTFLVSGSSDTHVIVWDLSSGVDNITSRVLTGHTQAIWTVAISPDGTRIASSGQEGIIFIWDVQTGSILARLAGSTSEVYTLAFAPDGQSLASGEEDGTVRLWDISDLSAVTNTILQPNADTPIQGAIYSVAFSPNGATLAAGCDNRTLYLWNTETLVATGFTGFEGAVRAVAYSPTRPVLAAGDGSGNIVLVNTATGSVVGTLITPEENRVNSLAFAPDGSTLSSGTIDTSIYLWDTRTSQPLARSLSGHEQSVLAVATSPTNADMVASASGDVFASVFGALWLWNAETGEHRELLVANEGLILSLAFSPDGQTLAAGSLDEQIFFFNTESGAQTTVIDTGVSIFALAYNADVNNPLIATGDSNGGIQLWSGTGAEVSLLSIDIAGHTDRINSLAFSPDNTLLVSGSSDETVRLWNVTTGELVGEPFDLNDSPFVSEGVTSVAFSPDGQLVAAGTRDGMIRLWSVATREPYGQPLVLQDDWILSIDFSADSSLLAAGTRTRFVTLWDVSNGLMLGLPLRAHRDQVYSLAFASDGQSLVSGGGDSLILVWDVSLDSWKQRACRIANRTLTIQEWERYLETQPYETICPISQ